MKNLIFIILFFSTLSNCLFAQKHSLGLFVDPIKHVTAFDQMSDQHENISLPYPAHIGFQAGLVYTHWFKGESNLVQVSIMEKGTPYSIMWSSDNFRSQRTHGDRHLAFQAGLGRSLHLANSKAIQFILGYSLRRVYKPSTDNLISSNPVPFVNDCERGCLRSFIETNYQLKGNFHSSLYLKSEYDFWTSKNGKNKFSLNLIANLGLHQIKQSLSTVEFENGTKSEFWLNDYGNYYGVGLTYSRISNDKFKDLFKVRSNNGKLDKTVKIVGGVVSAYLIFYMLN